MSPSQTDPLLAVLTARGYSLVIRGGRLAICPAGAPPEIVNQVRAYRTQLLRTLLYVPEHLADWSLEDMRSLAWRMLDFIDGPAPFEERTSFLPEFLRLVDRINFREDKERDRGSQS